MKSGLLGGGWRVDGNTVPIFSSLLFSSLLALHCVCISVLWKRKHQEVIDRVRGERANHDAAQKNRRVSWPPLYHSSLLLASLTFLSLLFTYLPPYLVSFCFLPIFYFFSRSLFLFPPLFYGLPFLRSTFQLCLCVSVCVHVCASGERFWHTFLCVFFV